MNNEDFKNKEYRDAFVDAMISAGIAFQVKALRKRESWSQKELGEQLDTPQNVISRYENPDYGSFSLKTLQRLASAFDVALIVKFASFGELRKLTLDRSPEALAVPNFEMEQTMSGTEEATDTAFLAEPIASATTADAQVCSVTYMAEYIKCRQAAGASDISALNSEDTQKDGYSHGNC